MNATAVSPHLPERRASGRSLPWSSAAEPAAQLFSFGALALYAALSYAELETGPPRQQVLGTVAVAALGGSALALTGRARPGRRTGALRVAVLVVTTVLALAVIGLPVRLLWPGGWPGLAGLLSHGLGGLTGDLWPYRGADPQVRLVVLLTVPVCVVTAAALAFWPGSARAASRRRNAALFVLLGLYVIALVNQPTGAWAVHGLALLVLLAAWLWLARLVRPGGGRALTWLWSCALVALILAAVLRAPGPWLHYRHWDVFGAGPAPTSFQWDQLYGPIPWSRSRAPMFEVSSVPGELWKVTTLDRFDGVGFLRSDSPPAAPPGRAQGGVATFQDVGFTVRGFHSRLLAGAGQVLSANITASEVTHRAQVAPDGTGVLPEALQPGDTYTVTAYEPHATPAQLRHVPATVPPAFRAYTQFQLPAPGQPRPVDLVSAARPRAGAALTVGPLADWRSTVSPPARRRIESSPYARMFGLARRLADRHTDAYDVAQSMAAFLRRNYAYDERPPVRAYPLPAFLFTDGVGYCQQFSAAMALMLRMDGIPARVAEGFLPGTFDPVRHVWRVTALDAHAWVEVYLPTIGWWTFDPTPPRRTTEPALAGARLRGLNASLAALGLNRGAIQGRLPTAQREITGRSGRSARRAGRGGLPLGLVALGLLGALAALTAGLTTVGTLRLRRGLDGEGEGAVAELRRALERLGYVAPADLTLTRLARRLEATHGPAAGRYVLRLAQRRYRPAAELAPPTPADRRALRRALVSHGGPRSRVLGLLALPPALSGRRWR